MRYGQTAYSGFRRSRFARFGGAFMAAAAFLLFFIDFFHFAFHIHSGCHTEGAVIASSAPGAVTPLVLSESAPGLEHSSFCPVCEGILVSDGPPPAQYGPEVFPYAADPIFSGIGTFASLSFLYPRGRAPPSVL